MRLTLLAIVLAIVSVLSLSAQQLEWSVDMNAVLNNREGGDDETPDQTFIFTRITPQIGVSMDKGRHRIMGGVTWYQPMNDGLNGYKVVPALHYQFEDFNRGVKFKFGVIPNELDVTIPTFLRSDSLNYLNPNIMGAVVEVNKKHFWLYSWLDWRQLRTKNKREAFDITAQLGWRTVYNNSLFSLGATLRYSHLAKRHEPAGDDGVVDNVHFNPQFRFVRTWPWYGTSVDMSLGMLLSLDRDRSDNNGWRTPAGFMGSVKATWKWLSLVENIYAGGRQMPLYDKFGPLLYLGDQHYHNKFYSRTDLVATIFQRSYLNLEAKLTFNVTSKTTTFWQQLAVRFFLDRKLWHDSKNKKRGLPLQPQF